MNVIIIEDEKLAARRLERMLSSQNLAVSAVLHSVAEAILWFQTNKHPDLIFLDIQLSDGISFEIFDHVEINSAIIFTTAYDEYAIRAFKLNSIDYLLKPLDEEELTAAIQKFENQKESVEQLNIGELKNFINATQRKNYKNRFTVQIGQHLKLIETTEISCFFSQEKATYINTVSGRNYLLDSSLENLELELDPEQFYKINRKAIIKLSAIKDIVSFTNSRLEIKLNTFTEFPLIVSRERVKGFKTWLEG